MEVQNVAALLTFSTSGTAGASYAHSAVPHSAARGYADVSKRCVGNPKEAPRPVVFATEMRIGSIHCSSLY